MSQRSGRGGGSSRLGQNPKFAQKIFWTAPLTGLLNSKSFTFILLDQIYVSLTGLLLVRVLLSYFLIKYISNICIVNQLLLLRLSDQLSWGNSDSQLARLPFASQLLLARIIIMCKNIKTKPAACICKNNIYFFPFLPKTNLWWSNNSYIYIMPP